MITTSRYTHLTEQRKESAEAHINTLMGQIKGKRPTAPPIQMNEFMPPV